MKAWPLLIMAVVAGCLSPPKGGDVVPADSDLDFLVGDDPASRTTAAAPRWATGEWWQYHVLLHYTGAEYDVTRVVAGRDGDNYTVGMPLEDWEAMGDNVIGYHLPGLGDVRVSDLMYEVHDLPYKLLDFPLQAGDSWQAGFEFSEVIVTVESADAAGAVMRVEKMYEQAWGPVAAPVTNRVLGDVYTARAEYDARLGEVRLLDIPGYARVEVVDHGYGFEGTVRVPRNQGMPFVNGRIAGLPDRNDPTHPITGEAHVEDVYDRMALTLGAGSLAFEGQQSTGYYKETARGPDGEYVLEKVPPNTALEFKHFSVERPGGAWTFEHIAIGPGGAQSEAFAYEIHDVTVPGLQVTRPAWRTA